MIVSPITIVRALRACGYGYRKTALHAGVGMTTVRRWVVPGYAERSREQSNAAKRRRTGTCVDCGATTRYGGKGDGVSARCVPCGNALAREKLTLWTRDRVIVAIQQWHAIYGRTPSVSEWWNKTDRSPAFTTVYNLFGAWGAALEAAGFEARSPGGYASQCEHPVVLTPGRLKHREMVRRYRERRSA